MTKFLTMKPALMTVLALPLMTGLVACQDETAVAERAAENATEMASDGASDAMNTAKDAVSDVKSQAAAKMTADQDITTMPAGEYTDEDGHAYIAFSYSHQGYSNPILRYNGDAFAATLDLNPADVTASTLMVDLDTGNIDSGVAKFDDHLRSADFFDVETHPTASFRSTSLSMDTPTTGTLVGDLTMKGITKPVVLDVQLNKVGENFRSKVPMFGISASGDIKRSDWDLGQYAPMVGDEVELMIEVEFQKSDAGE